MLCISEVVQFWSFIAINSIIISDCGAVCFSQPTDADVVARPAEDGGSQPEGPDEHELHQVTQQPGRPTDCVCV